MNREFLQLAHVYKPERDHVAGRFMSEKLDGMRVFWDGGVTRGHKVSSIPWANTLKSNAVELSTGLWSRYGNPINAPDYWVDSLPPYCLDGELWIDYGEFQYLMSIVRSNVNVKTAEWDQVKFYVFDMPHPERVFADGKINNVNYAKTFRDIDISEFDHPLGSGATFRQRSFWLSKNLPRRNRLVWLEQRPLSMITKEAEQEIEAFSDEVLERGGEGLILKTQADLWTPKRVRSVLKVKPWLDAEATVVGYTWGRETDKGSKLLGLMGALIVKSEAGEFPLSGFTDQERVLSKDGKPYKATSHPGQPVEAGVENERFPIGSKVTFRYRTVTDSGLPREARFHRTADA